MKPDEYTKLFHDKIDHICKMVIREFTDFQEVHTNITQVEGLLIYSGFVDTVVLQILKDKHQIVAKAQLAIWGDRD